MDMDDLYRDIILDHCRNPRNRRNLEGSTEAQVHENPSCGDEIRVSIETGPHERLEKIWIDPRGCAISVASASMMSEFLEGKSFEQAIRAASEFCSYMRGERNESLPAEWGDLASLAGVIRYPLRVKCATLPWHAVEATIRIFFP